MAMPTTRERREMQARIGRATPGPWTLHRPGSGYETIEGPPAGEHPRIVLAKEKVHGHSEDYAFIAHARQDLPRCLEALEAAESLLRDATALAQAAARSDDRDMAEVGEELAARITAFLSGGD